MIPFAPTFGLFSLKASMEAIRGKLLAGDDWPSVRGIIFSPRATRSAGLSNQATALSFSFLLSRGEGAGDCLSCPFGRTQ